MFDKISNLLWLNNDTYWANLKYSNKPNNENNLAVWSHWSELKKVSVRERVGHESERYISPP